MRGTPAARARVGAIRYLNALPLVAGLDRDDRLAEVRYEVPSLLARDLHAGRLELALVPQVAVWGRRGFRIVPELCIASRGAVESILLFLRRDLEQLERVGVDSSSRSSVELLRVLLDRRLGRVPELIPVPPTLGALRGAAPDGGRPLDALLLIGDRALAEDTGEFRRLDLGALWTELTGLPFVYAVWAGPAPSRSDAVASAASEAAVAAVRHAARHGLRERAALAEAFCREHPEVIDPARARRYLEEVIHYHLGPDELEALWLFHGWRAEAGLDDPSGRGEPEEPAGPLFFDTATSGPGPRGTHGLEA